MGRASCWCRVLFLLIGAMMDGIWGFVLLLFEELGGARYNVRF